VFEVITSVLNSLYQARTDNVLNDGSGERLFDPPLLAAAAADDPWFARFKEIIGPFHWTPQEALAIAAPAAQARSVICWCLPIGEAAREANRAATRFPASPWAYTRTVGETLLPALEHGLAEYLRGQGFNAVAPATIPQNMVEPRPKVGLSSCWSLRHVSFAAGLGTFGLSGGLITRRGIAHRLGSVVTDAPLEPTPRSYGDDPFAWCLRMTQGTCGACIKRCPVASVGQGVQDRNKAACLEQSRSIRKSGPQMYGWQGRYGCGLYQTGVPCEFTNPTS
jgi:epoxyqueuosine reductase